MIMKTLQDIKKIAVLGAGTMGPGIAQTFAMGGYDVSMWTRSESTREKAKESLKASLKTFAEEGIIKAEDVDAIFNRVKFALTVPEAVEGADFVMETIVEKADAKRELFDELDKILPFDTILASNTSALNIFEIVPERRLPQTVIAHWYAPPQLIPLVEVVKSEQAPQEYADITVAMLEKCGKTAVPMKKFIRGYIVNRLQMCLNQEVFFLLDNGYCTPEDIDRAVKASFIPRAMVLGICKRIDFGGVDMTANNFKNKSYTFPPPTDMPKTLGELMEKGHLGVKAGKGLYDYTGVDMKALMAKRDKQLFEAFRLAKKMMDDPV
jgi:3-hydroxybutyryl-CoA dehydrogenase